MSSNGHPRRQDWLGKATQDAVIVVVALCLGAVAIAVTVRLVVWILP